jgi:hypothetical protein
VMFQNVAWFNIVFCSGFKPEYVWLVLSQDDQVLKAEKTGHLYQWCLIYNR